MQKLFTTSKTFDNDTRTFLFHKCLSFLKKPMIEGNALDIVYFKMQKQFYSRAFKQISVNITGNILIFCPKGATSLQHQWLGWSLGDWSCWMRRRRVLLVLLFVNQNRVLSHYTRLKIVKS